MSKVMKLKDAIAKYVEDGDVISLGGFTTNRKPYACLLYTSDAADDVIDV